MKLLLVFSLILPLGAQQRSSRAAYSSILDEVFPHFADGGGWKSTITLVNMRDTPAAFKLEFFSPAGQPQTVPLRGRAPSSVYAGTIPVEGSMVFETLGEAAATQTGWARVDSSQHIGGTLVFSRAGTPTLEAAIPLTSYSEDDFILPFDNTNGFSTSMAIVHPGSTFSSAETITVAFHNEQGERVHLDQFTLSTRAQQAFEIGTRWPQVAGRRGTAHFRGGFYLSAIGLRFHPSGSFTTVNTLSR